MTHYDLLVIGSGSGNMLLDSRFDNLRTAIVERSTFGGTCLNVGCIPTKMYVWPADIAAYAGDGPRLGVDTAMRGARWVDIRDRVFGRIDAISHSGLQYRDSLENVEVLRGHGRFVGDRRLTVTDTDGQDVTGSPEGEITADRIVVATGSRVSVPPIEGLEEAGYETSDTVMRLDAQPERIVIIGGGFVSCEFAHVFHALGTEVVQVQRGPRLLMAEDDDVSARITDIACRAWDVRLGVTVDRVEPGRDGADHVLHLSNGETLEADTILVATGRDPNTDDMGLDLTGVEVDDDGLIVTDEFLRAAEGVFALGDCRTPWQLKHVANLEARLVGDNLASPEDMRALPDLPVPHAVFTHPQIASVGATERELVEQGRAYEKKVQDYADIAYGWAMEDTTGFAKLLADPDTGLLLGAHLIGPQASALIQPLIQMMSLGQTTQEVARGQYWIHPALPELVENALLGLEQRPK
ncbi:mycothione reductase [Nocardioidaceae bacterium]|nr:mycothione reductase [Nocardioidaceae bacterium]